MTKLSKIIRRFSVMAIFAMTVSGSAFAQGYYDDDIYYDASKSKKEKKVQQKKQTVSKQSSYYGNRNNSGYQVADYPAADTYTVNGSLNMDVDTYNRRGQFLVPDSIPADSLENGDFTYTQRIERFHNPDVVSGSEDQELRDYYSYAMQQPQNVNIYVIDNDPWYYYGPSWSWRYGNPWYWNSWGPSWSLSWGWNSWAWDPYWSWGWGPSWSWGPSWGWGPGWYPSYCPGWDWGWSGPVHAWRPTTPSGSSRPHPSVGGAGATHRPGGYGSGSTATNRPGNMGRGRYGYGTTPSATPSRPGNYTPSTGNGSHNNSQSTSRPGNMGRGRSNYNSTNNDGYRQSSRPSNNNSYTPNYNHNSGSHNSGSFSPDRGRGGYSGSHGTMGGGSSRGGGGGRGRR